MLRLRSYNEGTGGGGNGDDLDTAVDLVHDRFGSRALTRAGLLGRDQGLSVPLLPD